MIEHSDIILASRSPRRRELLEQIGLSFRVMPADIDESFREGESAPAFVERMALEKARAVAAEQAEAVVIGSDTAVVLDDHIMGKPRDRAHAADMLSRLSGRTHQVLSSVAVLHAGREAVRLSTSEVRFRPATPEEAAAYWASGEPADKAGGYAIQGLGAVFVENLNGSYSGVMGLPLYETAQLLANVGLDLP